MILGDETSLKINLSCVHSSDNVTLLGVMIDKNLTFKKQTDSLIRKAQYKFHTLRRIRKCFCRQSVQLCTFNMNVLWENILF